MLPPDEQPIQSAYVNSRAMVPHEDRRTSMMPRSAEYDSSYYDGYSDQPQTPEILTNPFDASWVWHSFRRRWVLALGMGVLVGVSLAAAAWLLTPKKFTARSLIQVGSQQKHSIFDVNMGTPDIEYKLFQATQVQLIKSPIVLSSATGKQSVASQPSMQELSPNEQIPWLSDRLEIGFLEGSEILQISMTGDEDAEELKAYVKAVTESYMSDVVYKEEGIRARVREALRAAKENATRSINEKMQTYISQIQTLGTSDSLTADVDRKLLLDQISSMMRQKADYVKQLALAEMKYESDRQAARDRTLIAMSDKERMNSDPFLQQLLFEQAQAQGEIARLQLDQGGPRATSAAVPLKRKVASIDQMVRQRQTELTQQYEAQRNENPNSILRLIKRTFDTQEKYLTKQIASLEEEISNLENSARQMGKRDAKMEMLKAELDHEREVEQEMAIRLTQAEIESNAAGARGPKRIEVVQPARAEPNLGVMQRYAIVGAAGVLGFLLTCFGIAYLEFRFRRLNGPEQLEEGLGIRVVGSLPSLAFRNSSRDGSDPMLALLMESVDNVRTALMHDASSRSDRIVMVTSASGHEGRTTVASQLAASLARAGRRTLLIDGDLRHPSLHALFDLPLEEGLCEVLRAEVDVDDAVRPTYAEGLWVLTAGFCDVNAIQAMAREQLQPIFDKLREQYDFIILDAPPVLNISDSLIMGQYVDGAVISVLRDVSKVPQVHKAYERLRGMGIRVLGAVVNGVRTDANERTERMRLVAPASTRAVKEEVASPV